MKLDSGKAIVLFFVHQLVRVNYTNFPEKRINYEHSNSRKHLFGIHRGTDLRRVP